MKLKFTFFAFFFCIAALSQLKSQNNGNALIFSLNYGVQKPLGDLADRFGNNLYTGLQADYMTEKGNWIIGIQQTVLFGSAVKEDVLSTLRNSNGIIFSNTLSQANIELKERGWHSSIHIGKLIPLLKDNKRSGIRIHLGVGVLQHKIRIQDDPNSFVPQLTDDLKKGYDRQANGLAVSQFIGYQHHSKNRLVNFIAGFEFIEGFTQNRRSFDYDLQSQNIDERKDILVGFRIGWSLPLYIGEDPDTIFY